MLFVTFYMCSREKIECICFRGKTVIGGPFVLHCSSKIVQTLPKDYIYLASPIHPSLRDLDVVLQSQQHWKCETERCFLGKFWYGRVPTL